MYMICVVSYYAKGCVFDDMYVWCSNVVMFFYFFVIIDRLSSRSNRFAKMTVFGGVLRRNVCMWVVVFYEHEVRATLCLFV